ncbi:MAG: PilZ domain-containing protein [Candidatus Acidiferrales bacterium]
MHVAANIPSGENQPRYNFLIVETAAKERRYPRMGLPKGMMVAWRWSQGRSVSRVSTIGLGGLFISTRHPPPVGEIIKLIFEVPGGEVRARAIVRDSEPGKGLGVMFVSMTTEARARLRELMKRLTR